MKLKDKIVRTVNRLMTPLAQTQDNHNPVKTVTPGMPELLRHAAAQGAVLLENRVLPFGKGSRIAVFGRVQKDYFNTGYGSGGDVNFPYSVSLLEGLRNCEDLEVEETLAAVYEAWIEQNPADHGIWGMWPRNHPEMPVSEELAAQAKEKADNAVIVLGRSSGEDRENVLEPGSYYLTEEEKNLLATVTRVFPDAVLVLNIGAVMDFSFLEEYSFGAVLILWQGGMESGNAAADLLSGKVSPSGRLSDTVTQRYEDHPSAACFGQKEANAYEEDIYVGYRWFETFAPEKVRYPFGYGLTYTTFENHAVQTEGLNFRVTVTNTGSCRAKQTVMLFVEKPQGALGNPARELVSFGKTRELAPGESQELSLKATRYQLASYDDSGAAGHKSAYILQAGEYRFYCGENVRDARLCGTYAVETDTIVKQHVQAGAPAQPFAIWANRGGKALRAFAAAGTADLKARILENLPKSLPTTGDQGWKLKDVKSGKIDLDTFVSQLDLTELEAISRGAYIMGHPLGARGNAGVFGGVTESLREKGVPAVTTTDGPSGIRLYDSCSLLPIGTLLACSFDVELVQKLYTAVAGEMKQRGSHILLAPGMNIHRNPLCGRNFEYFSEDPYLTGRMAAAVVKGVQSQGLSACPKHFACNSQETNRNKTDSIVSERALREIYLKGFEICVKLAKPRTLMTSYNKINGVWGHYQYDLVTTILRGEWGFDGLVMTDWWMQYASSPEFPGLKGNAYRVRAGVDVLMPGSRSFTDKRRRPDGTLLATYGKPDGITLGEMQETAKRVLRCVMELREL
ncbi:MAG: glycoside hydrolase family 3 C-terminal domain-containing protein [Oscillospiraceae bacterium]|nr:glycoside hydrolase family 3 C-terminal domain-containing protein [Oscillospiraceae bacterium]